MIANIDYEKLIPSKAVRTMMNMKNLDDKSIASLIMNGYYSKKERLDMFKQLDKSVENGEVRTAIQGYINIYSDSEEDQVKDKGNYSLLYSYVEIFNPFERGDIVYRVGAPNDIGIVITSQRKWMANRNNYKDFNDDLIKVDFILADGSVRNAEICPVNLDFVQPGCELPQYDYLKSLHNLIKGNGNIKMVTECYNELRGSL